MTWTLNRSPPVKNGWIMSGGPLEQKFNIFGRITTKCVEVVVSCRYHAWCVQMLAEVTQLMLFVKTLNGLIMTRTVLLYKLEYLYLNTQKKLTGKRQFVQFVKSHTFIQIYRENTCNRFRFKEAMIEILQF